MELQDYRDRLDQIDGQLAELFKRRMETVREVADYKKEHGTPVYAAGRERDILYRVTGLCGPELEEYTKAWTAAMLASPFRKDFAAEYGDLMFVNAEIELKTFAPEIVPQLQRENDLTQEHQKLIASAKVPFEGKTYTLAQMGPFQNDADDERRLSAWKAVVQGQPARAGPHL